jgi:two-component system alkaline phosphatase synthesis response regulator PhoP
MPPNQTVLVVEDDGDLSEALKIVIEDLGWRAICAANGREALALLESELPSLMLVDLFMPIMNGVEMLKVIKRDATLAAIPRVIMTAANDRMIGVKEDVPVLYKPVDIDTLSRLLAQYSEPRRTPAL